MTWGWTEPGGPWPSIEVLSGPLTDRARFPNLKCLVVREPTYGWSAAAFTGRLESLAWLPALGLLLQPALIPSVVVEWRASQGPAELRLAVGRMIGLEFSGWVVVLRRADPAVTVAWSGGSAAERRAIGPIVRALGGAGCTSLAVHPGRAELELVVHRVELRSAPGAVDLFGIPGG